MDDIVELIEELNEQILTDSFTYLETLGSGAFGQVVKAFSKSLNQIVAIKILDRVRNRDQENEGELLEKCDHPNIVQFHKLLYSRGHIYLVMEYLEGQTLDVMMQSRKQKGFSEREIRKLVSQILEGLSYLHQQKIIHRDLKPSNIMIAKIGDKSRVKLIDLGLGYQMENYQKTKQLCGTITYFAPELALAQPYSCAVDIFALGIIFFQLYAHGEHPIYKKEYTKQEYFAILTSPKLTLEYPEEMPENAIDFVNKTLRYSPNDRMSAFQCLDHSFIKNTQNQLLFPITTNEVMHTFSVKYTMIKAIQACMFVHYLTQNSKLAETTSNKSYDVIRVQTEGSMPQQVMIPHSARYRFKTKVSSGSFSIQDQSPRAQQKITKPPIGRRSAAMGLSFISDQQRDSSQSISPILPKTQSHSFLPAIGSGGQQTQHKQTKSRFFFK